MYPANDEEMHLILAGLLYYLNGAFVHEMYRWFR